MQNMKLATKISTVVISLLILGFGVVSIISYTVSSGILSKTIQTNLMNSVNDAATIFNNKQEAMKTEAILIAQSSDMQTMNWDIQKTALSDVTKTMGYFSAAVADTRGAANFINGPTANISERDYFKKAMNGETTLTDPLMSKADNMLVVVVATPIMDNRNQVIGVLMLGHEASALTGMADDISVGKTGYAYMINNQGVIIAHPDIEKVINQYSFIDNASNDASLRPPAEIQKRMVAGETGYDEYSYQGTLNITSFTPVPNTNWSIGLEVPKREFFSDMTTLLLVIIAVTAAFIVVCIVLLLFMIRSAVIRPLMKLVGISERIAIGDIELNVEITSKDEFSILGQAFQKIIDNAKIQARSVEEVSSGDLTVEVPVRSSIDLLGLKLNEMINSNNEVLCNIRTAADQVAQGAKQLSDSSVLLSQGATEQASSIEQLAVSIEEISEKTNKNAEHASEASQLAERAKSNAEQGDNQMREMLEAMQDINASSDSISKIIKVIDDIAFQTNILALNAAVEAARAGQHGKGFAVVAEEVRNLAARSANAAKETTELIENSVRKVDTGTRIANHTASSLSKIVSDIANASELVDHIAEASQEQSVGIIQIKQALSQVNLIVQTNTATAEEGAASSEELASQADIMKEQVKRFILRAAQHDSDQKTSAGALLNPSAKRLEAPKARISLGRDDFGKY